MVDRIYFKLLLIFFISLQWNCSAGYNISKTFRCNDGSYIEDEYYCNNILDCHHGDDENTGCNDYDCMSGTFKCNNSETCLSVRVLCDTHNDCSDGSDEANCGDEINVHNCSIKDGKFLCKDGKRCLGFEYTCDGYCNCFDCSDENSNCSKVDNDLLRKCPNSYFPTPEGAKCLCDPSDSEWNNLCEELKNCTYQRQCPQRCTMYKHKIQCSCDENHVGIPETNGFLCRSKVHYASSLVYSTSNQIKLANLTTDEVTVVKKGVECAFLTAAHDNIYYTTFNNDRRSIFKTSITSKVTTEVVKLDSPIVSIAVDYITNSIYFTTNDSLLVCSDGGFICTKLKNNSVNYVALAPKFGIMFYTMKANFRDERFIMKSNLDGTNEDFLVDGSFRSFVPLVVDESNQRLYWLESDEYVIHSLLFADDNNETLSYSRSLRYSGSLYSFTALENKLYFTKDHDNEIYIMENFERFVNYGFKRDSVMFTLHSLGGAPITPIHYGIPLELLSDRTSPQIVENFLTFAVRSVFAYNPLLQHTQKAENPCKSSSCPGLCLLRRGSSTKGLDYSCLCEDFTPSSVENWCKSSTQPVKAGFEFTPKNEADSYTKLPQTKGHSTVVVVLSILGVMIALAVASFFAFRKWGGYGCYDTIQNCTLKSNENVDIICPRERL